MENHGNLTIKHVDFSWDLMGIKKKHNGNREPVGKKHGGNEI